MADDPLNSVVCVIDCPVYFQAVVSDISPAAACFDLAFSGRIRLIISDAIEAEVRDVLARPKLLKKRPYLKRPEARDLVNAMISVSHRIAEVPHVFSYPRDPKDEPYLNLAIAGHAEYLVSRDRDLLDLESRDSPVGQDLRKLAPRLRIVDPVELLRLLR